MKSIFFKIVMPVAAIILAIGSSISTHASQKRAHQFITGYINPVGSNLCSITASCTDVGGVLCTATYQSVVYQAFGKEAPSDSTCPVLLFRPSL